jgi:hypothetical protein
VSRMEDIPQDGSGEPFPADGKPTEAVEPSAAVRALKRLTEMQQSGLRGAWRRAVNSGIAAARRVLREEIDADALSTPPATAETLLGAWRPIEGAPRDRFVLLAVPASGGCGAFVAMAKWQGRGWYGVDDEGLTFNPILASGLQPTHWQPLPPPPGQELSGMGEETARREPLRMLVDEDWLRERVATDPDVDAEAGGE